MRIYVVRHGESSGNEKKIYQGPYEGLSLTGQMQVRNLANNAQKWGLINPTAFVSPFLRAQQTAEIFCNAFPHLIWRYCEDPDLKEYRGPQSFVGLPKDREDLQEQIKRIRYSWQNGIYNSVLDEEPLQEFVLRVQRSFRHVIQSLQEQESSCGMVFTHKRVMQGLFASLPYWGEPHELICRELSSSTWDSDIPNCSVIRLEVEDGYPMYSP